MFEVRTSKSIDKGKINFNKNGIYQFIGRTKANNGIQGNLDRIAFEPNPKNTFSVSQVGTIVAQFRNIEWYGSQNMFILYPLEFSNNILSNFKYMVAAINKGLQIFDGGYSNYPTLKTLSDLTITLPTYSNSDIAFDYMTEYIKELEAERIKELEAERIKELEAYLLATRLNDYVLTDEEKKLIEDFKSGTVHWETFKIVDVFKVKNTKNILSRDIVKNSGEIPYLTAREANNSIETYISHDLIQIEEGNSIFIGGKTFTVTYQELNYFSNDSHNLALYYKEEDKRTRANQLFMVTSIYKSLSHLYSWGNSISNKKIQNDCIKFPIMYDGKPDFDKMSAYIRAIEKLVIKDVVKWKDKQIAMTAKIVNEHTS